jgi:hypothetical protein
MKFLDLAGSTHLAEAMGELRVHDFIPASSSTLTS